MIDTQDLLEQSFELNLNNYGPEDVDRLNDWAIKAHDKLKAAQAEIERLKYEIDAIAAIKAERDAAQTRLAELEKQEPVEWRVTERGVTSTVTHAEFVRRSYDCATFEPLFAAAGASPVQPKEVIKEIVVHADYREMWRQQLKMNQKLNAALSAMPATVQPSQAGEPVARYELECYDEDCGCMEVDSDGDWVRYSDYLAAFATPQAAAQPSQAGLSDTALLDWLQERCTSAWVCRDSTTGRGWRLHESRDTGYVSVRDAIIAAINAKESGK
jgi:hypothetical protein